MLFVLRRQHQQSLLYEISKSNKRSLKHTLKFVLSEKHTKFEKIFLMVLTNQLIYLVNFKTMRKVFSNYVCFSKSVNFNFHVLNKLKISFLHVLFIQKTSKLLTSIRQSAGRSVQIVQLFQPIIADQLKLHTELFYDWLK